MTDNETTRAVVAAVLNAEEASRTKLESKYGQVWDTKQLQSEFSVTGFAAPCVIATQRSTGKKGTLFFQHSPRFYWGFA